MKKAPHPKRITQKVFLSYAYADRQSANRIAQALMSAGSTVWYEVSPEIKPGGSFAEHILDSIHTSDLLVVLLSPHALKSRWTQFELNVALSRELSKSGVTVIPAVLETCTIPGALANRQFIDFRSDFEGALQRLVKEVGFAPVVDFSHLTGRTFEQLIGDFLTALGFDVRAQQTVRDIGFDFRATIAHRDPFGAEQKQTWLVESKFYTQERVSVTVLAQMIEHLTTLPEHHKGLVVTNSELTSAAHDYLSQAAAKLRIDLRVIGGAELKGLLLQFPALVKRYFAGGK